MQLPFHLLSQKEQRQKSFLWKCIRNPLFIYVIAFTTLISFTFVLLHQSRHQKQILKYRNYINAQSNSNDEQKTGPNTNPQINEKVEKSQKLDNEEKVDDDEKIVKDEKIINPENGNDAKNDHIRELYDNLNPNTKYELYYPDEDDLQPSEESIRRCERFSSTGSEFNQVPDEEQNVIEDPYEYVHQPPERPLIPRNFYQKIKGVHNLEISPGVIVPHNFSGIKTDRVVKFNKHLINVTTFDSGNVKEHFVYLPPFDWKVPHGLTKHQLDLFFKQPENHWHFNDCKMWSIDVIWEVKNGVSKLSNHKTCTNHNYTNNLNFCEWPKTLPEGQKPQNNGDVFAFGGHYIEIFQHFFDNGISHMAAMSFGLGLDRIPNITLFSAGCGSTCGGIMNKFGFKNVQGCKNVNNEVSAENLIIIPSMRVLHPYYFEFFRYKIDSDPPKMTMDQKIEKYKQVFNVQNVTEETIYQKNKVIFLPRGHGSGGNARIIYNIDDLVNRLKKIHGDENVVVYRKSDSHRLGSIDDMRFFFGRAKAIVAPHGGACYNHFFSDVGIDFVEMIPMLDNGKYPKQPYWNRLIPFAHLAFLSSVQLHAQRFWRYLTMNVDINYNIDVDDFINWSQQIPSLAKAGSIGEVDIKN